MTRRTGSWPGSRPIVLKMEQSGHCSTWLWLHLLQNVVKMPEATTGGLRDSFQAPWPPCPPRYLLSALTGPMSYGLWAPLPRFLSGEGPAHPSRLRKHLCPCRAGSRTLGQDSSAATPLAHVLCPAASTGYTSEHPTRMRTPLMGSSQVHAGATTARQCPNGGAGDPQPGLAPLTLAIPSGVPKPHLALCCCKNMVVSIAPHTLAATPGSVPRFPADPAI